jgi:hypothetical protein
VSEIIIKHEMMRARNLREDGNCGSVSVSDKGFSPRPSATVPPSKFIQFADASSESDNYKEVEAYV